MAEESNVAVVAENEVNETEATEVVLTKEEKKALRKAKFKRVLKMTGLVVGVAAVSGGTAYLIGRITGKKDGGYGMLSSICTHAANDKDFASACHNNKGETAYVIHTFTREKPEWWDEGESVDLYKEF